MVPPTTGIATRSRKTLADGEQIECRVCKPVNLRHCHPVAFPAREVEQKRVDLILPQRAK